MFVLSVQNKETKNNSYFYVDEKSRHSILIEPDADIDLYKNVIGENNLTIEKIICFQGTPIKSELFQSFNNNISIQYYIYERCENKSKSCLNIMTTDGTEIELDVNNYFSVGDEITISTQPEIVLNVLMQQDNDCLILYDKLNKIAFCSKFIAPENKILPEDVEIYSVNK